jgi:hypothetical protein
MMSITSSVSLAGIAERAGATLIDVNTRDNPLRSLATRRGGFIEASATVARVPSPMQSRPWSLWAVTAGCDRAPSGKQFEIPYERWHPVRLLVP